MSQQQTFKILEVQTREYSRFNTRVTQWKVRLKPPPPTIPPPHPVVHFVQSVNNLFDYVLEDVGDAYMVAITIHNEINQNGTPIGFSFRRKDHLSSFIIRRVFGKVAQTNSRFNLLDTQIVAVHSLTMPLGFGRSVINQNGRPIANMLQLNRSFV